jgi:hypothetical protein
LISLTLVEDSWKEKRKILPHNVVKMIQYVIALIISVLLTQQEWTTMIGQIKTGEATQITGYPIWVKSFGILLGFVCLFSTILIIYYKQISEGYEDRARFQIMEKIGMEPSEVRKTIGSQLVLQFFLPLVTAGVHTAFAFPILLKLLQVLMLSNTQLFILCTLITFAVFALVYTLVYLLTAKTYYKIVH